MLALQDIGDWIEGAIVLVVLVGSALSGLGKMILAKGKERKQAESEAKGEVGPSPRPVAHPMRPPVARPMPPPRLSSRRPSVIIRTESIPAEVESRRPPVEVDVQIPQAIRPLVEMLLGRTDEDELPAPVRPAPPPRTVRPRPQKPRPAPPTTAPTRPKLGNETRMARIEKREEDRAQRSDQRLGHVETHVKSAVTETDRESRSGFFDASDRGALRRAILMNEILGPPVSLRPAGA